MVSGVETLAETVVRWIHRQRLSYAAIARPGRLSRNTVKLIADGKTRQPDRDTLCKIAVGLAVDPYTGVIDQEVLVMTLRELGDAAGYDDLAGQWRTTTLPLLLTTVVGDLATAEAWVALIAANPQLDEEAVRQIGASLERES